MGRIISGTVGGMPLTSVPGQRTRPTTDRVKEAMFSRLEAGGVLAGARVLDLFAGSGALGCEALSRGAEHVDAVEVLPKAAAVCGKNLAAVLHRLPTATGLVHRVRAGSYIKGFSGRPWDVLFADPPYALENAELEELVDALVPHMAAEAVMVVERSARVCEPCWPPGVRRVVKKVYGQTVLYYLEPVVR